VQKPAAPRAQRQYVLTEYAADRPRQYCDQHREESGWRAGKSVAACEQHDADHAEDDADDLEARGANAERQAGDRPMLPESPR
jgi:hypothetical protein